MKIAHIKWIRNIILFLGLGWILGIVSTYFMVVKPMETMRSSKALLAIQDVVELSLIDAAISKVFEVHKENLKIGLFDVPFTSQDILVSSEGRAKIGFDLKELKIEKAKNEIIVSVSEPKVMSLDVSYRFLNENDTWLNRITTEERNAVLANVRSELNKEAQNPKLLALCLPKLQEALLKLEKLLGIPIRLK